MQGLVQIESGGVVTPPHSFRHYPVLGTELHVLVGCEAEAVAELAQARVLEECGRLEALLSTYRDDTALSRWMRGEDAELPVEVVAVLAAAEEWFVASEGVFHPDLGRLRTLWRHADRDGRAPSRDECARLAAQAERLPFTIRQRGGRARVERVGDCSDLDLDAIAKGWIVDRVTQHGLGPDVAWLLVNVGGDIRLAGPEAGRAAVRVAIEHPGSRVDNAPPLARVTMPTGGLASSGQARRGFQVAGAWYGHVLDPRTGWPTAEPAGVTVIAGDTATADALATVLSVRGLTDPVADALLTQHDAAALAVSRAGAVQVSDGWRDRVRPDLSS